MFGWFSASLIDAIRSLLIHSVIFSLGGPLSHGSPAVLFLDRGYTCFQNFYSTIPVDVVMVKSYMNCLFDPVRVVMRVTINKRYLVQSDFCPVLWVCSETAEVLVWASRMSVLLLNCVLHRYSILSDVQPCRIQRKSSKLRHLLFEGGVNHTLSIDRSVCVGLLCTLVARRLSGSLETAVSRKASLSSFSIS